MGQENKIVKKGNYQVHFHIGLSYVLSPCESRFIQYLLSREQFRKYGVSTYMNQSDYVKAMGLNNSSFRTSVRNLQKLGLLKKWNNSLGNKAFYTLDENQYERLIVILSSTNDLNELISFCQNTFKRGRSIESITKEEIKILASTRIKTEHRCSYLIPGETDKHQSMILYKSDS